jgi:hypothetical protein
MLENCRSKHGVPEAVVTAPVPVIGVITIKAPAADITII